jgi:hypothetical protein
LTTQQGPDAAGRVRQWAQGFVRGSTTDTLSLLKDLSAGVSAAVHYQSRDDEGTQSPLETLDRGWGSCRDFAVLFADAARCLGFGARIVSGYLYNPDRQSVGSSDAGSTHAPEFVRCRLDHVRSTNRSVSGYNHPGRRRTRHPPGRSGVRQLRRDDRRLRRHVSRGSRHIMSGMACFRGRRKLLDARAC